MRAPRRLVADQRRPTLAERDDVLALGRQHRGVPPHIGGPVRDFAASPAMPDDVEIVADQQRSAAFAEIGYRASLAPLSAETALQMRRLRHELAGYQVATLLFSSIWKL